MSTGPRPKDVDLIPRYRGSVSVKFSAALRIPGLEPHGVTAGRISGHDFTAVFHFETTTLAYPGVVVDDDMRAEITARVTDRLHHRDLDRLLDRPATCEAIADYLAAWYLQSARLPGHAQLVAVAVTTAAGDQGEIHLTTGGTR